MQLYAVNYIIEYYIQLIKVRLFILFTDQRDPDILDLSSYPHPFVK